MIMIKLMGFILLLLVELVGVQAFTAEFITVEEITALTAVLSVLAGVITAVFSKSGAIWVENKFKLTDKRNDELSEIRKSQEERISILETRTEESDKRIEDLFTQLTNKNAEYTILDNKYQGLDKRLKSEEQESNKLRKIVVAMLREINRLRRLVNEPPMSLEDFYTQGE